MFFQPIYPWPSFVPSDSPILLFKILFFCLLCFTLLACVLFLQPVGELGRVFTGIQAFLQSLYSAGNLAGLQSEGFQGANELIGQTVNAKEG